jgi:hypothetical protein
MPNVDISRQVQTVNVSTTYSLKDPDISQVICDATSAGFTVTLYDDLDSGAYHRVVVAISPNDSSGNTVTIVNAGATFSTSLDATSEAVEIETQTDGTWMIAAQFSTTQAATASSKADSAGLRASNAASTATSTALNASSATSASTSNSLIISQTGSVATSQNGSQSLNVSSTGSVAASAVLSGVSITASVATSQNGSQSLNVSSAMSLAAS